jgi:hypothetical protein
MANRKMPGVHNIRLKEVRELLKLPWVRDEELSDRWHDARLLPDGRVLHYSGGHISSTIFPSREAYAKFKRESEEPPLDVHTLLPPIDDFLRDVEVHAKSLGARLRIPNEVLDGSEASLEAVDNALKRVRLAKRMTPEIITPLVAYVGEVMRPPCGGHWTKFPTTEKKAVPVYDPAELAAFRAALRAKGDAAEKAAADVKARGGSPTAQVKARHEALFTTYERGPQPIRHDVVEKPVVGHENEPAIRARDGRLLQPFALVFVPMVEPSKRLPLRDGVDVTLLPYRSRQEKSTGSPGGQP